MLNSEKIIGTFKTISKEDQKMRTLDLHLVCYGNKGNLTLNLIAYENARNDQGKITCQTHIYFSDLNIRIYSRAIKRVTQKAVDDLLQEGIDQMNFNFPFQKISQIYGDEASDSFRYSDDHLSKNDKQLLLI